MNSGKQIFLAFVVQRDPSWTIFGGFSPRPFWAPYVRWPAKWEQREGQKIWLLVGLFPLAEDILIRLSLCLSPWGVFVLKQRSIFHLLSLSLLERCLSCTDPFFWAFLSTVQAKGTWSCQLLCRVLCTQRRKYTFRSLILWAVCLVWLQQFPRASKKIYFLAHFVSFVETLSMGILWDLFFYTHKVYQLPNITLS